MKKIFFLMLIFLIWSAASMNAQVLIGLGDEPDGSAVLELRSNNLGLLFPRVALKSTEDQSTIEYPVEGLAVYNTATVGNDATAVVPGIYVFNGTAWTLQAPPVIISQPTAFTFHRLYDVNGDPNAPTSVPAVTLSVIASGATSYQWYLKPKNLNAPASAIDGATSADYNPTSTLTAWGMYSYYCVVSNAYGSVKSDIADVAIGCGAKTIDGGWLSFMCHNLGADTSLDPFTYYSINDTTSKDIKGWLFQWGRIADGHQWRSSGTVLRANGVSGTFTTNNQIRSDSTLLYGKFITVTNTPSDWHSPQIYNLWNPSEPSNDPCPTGWRLPWQDEWAYIYKLALGQTDLNPTTANTWRWSGNGYEITPDGNVVTLFLPAAGLRREGDGGNTAGSGGRYHTSMNYATAGVSLLLEASRVSAFTIGSRASGRSVRCIKK
jgi:uncharacterized protein (TIGR02145 family)